MHAEKQWHNCSKKNKTNCVITRRTISDPLLTKWAIWEGQLYLLSDIKKKWKPNLNLGHFLSCSIGTRMHVYIYLRTFCGTEPLLINLRETLSQEPHRLGEEHLQNHQGFLAQLHYWKCKQAIHFLLTIQLSFFKFALQSALSNKI